MDVAEKHHTAWYRPAKLRRSALVGPALLFIISVGFFWKLVLTDQYTWLEGGDLANQVLPWLQFEAGEWHKGRFPMWSPYENGGHTLIGQAQPGVANPINWALFAMPLRHGWIRQGYLHWYYVFIHFLGALFAYWLCRDLQRSRLASIIAGCAFGLGGFIGTNDWPQMISGAIWAPLVFLFLLRSVRGERPVSSAVLSGFFLGISWLSGHHQIPIFITLTATATWLYYVFRPVGQPILAAQSHPKPHWHLARLMSVFLLFVFLAGALQTLPAYEYGKLSMRWVSLNDPIDWQTPVPYVVHRMFSLFPISLLGIIFPGVNRTTDPFIGLSIAVLAFLAVAVRWKEPMVRMFGLIAVSGAFFSLGSDNVLHGVLYSIVPLVEKARSPGMAIFIFHFGIVVLAAYGIDSFNSQERSDWPSYVSKGLVALGASILLLEFGILLAKRDWPADDRIALTAVIAFLLAGLIYGWNRGNLRTGAAAFFMLLLVLIELGNSTGFYLPHKTETSRTIYLKPLAQNADIITFLRKQPWPVRVEVKVEDIPFNFGDFEGIDTWGYYGASLPQNFWYLEPHTSRVRSLFGVNYSIGKKSDMQGQEEVFAGASDLKVYLNTKALPRVWTVHELFQIKTDDEMRRNLQDELLDFRQKAFMKGIPPKLETCTGQDQVSLLSRIPNQVKIQADMGCKGLVILGDGYFPGWQANVDGAPAPIYEVYGAIRGVVVDKGKHTIEMKYRPRSVLFGAFFTALAFVVAGIVGIKTGRRRT